MPDDLVADLAQAMRDANTPEAWGNTPQLVPFGHFAQVALDWLAERGQHPVAGHCPVCGGSSLILGAGGHITCARVDCSRPTAADEILADSETEHIVQLEPTTFTVRHPLRERLDDALMTCGLHAWIAALDGPPRLPGRYRVRGVEGQWFWLAAEEAADGS